MESLNFITNYWWIILVGIALLPTALWVIFVFIAPIIDQDWRFEYADDFAEKIVRQKDIEINGWYRLFIQNKLVRLVNLISFFWLWGFIINQIGWVIGRILRAMWRCLRWIGKGIARIYRAL